MSSSILIEKDIHTPEFIFKTYSKPSQDDEGYVVCHHGGGSSSHTFTVFIEALSKLNPKLGFLVFDARRHGYTTSIGEEKAGPITDLRCDVLEQDLVTVLTSVLPDTPANLLLIGHSMGGTVMSKFANSKSKPAHLNVRGLVVIDAVEGYGRKALSSMNALLTMWPKHFRNYREAISWHLEGGHQLRNRESAEISVPPLFIQNKETGFLDWKLDLKRTEPNWNNWFDGLDDYFLNAPAAKLLILAGVGRLDTSLTRGQMQGKFQLMIVSESGHYIQEDCPLKVAQAIDQFWSRNGKPIKIIPKFGQLRD